MESQHFVTQAVKTGCIDSSNIQYIMTYSHCIASSLGYQATNSCPEEQIVCLTTLGLLVPSMVTNSTATVATTSQQQATFHLAFHQLVSVCFNH